jgi:hypothetical protein
MPKTPATTAIPKITKTPLQKLLFLFGCIKVIGYFLIMAALSFAERLRGFFPISSRDGGTGFFVKI